MAYFSLRRNATIYAMISIDDFKHASFEKKCELVTSSTTYVTSRTDDNKKVYLYHSGRFFIEVFYCPLHKRIIFMHAFNNVNNMLPYTESVSLEDIMV
jgi:hypothetical protein